MINPRKRIDLQDTCEVWMEKRKGKRLTAESEEAIRERLSGEDGDALFAEIQALRNDVEFYKKQSDINMELLYKACTDNKHRLNKTEWLDRILHERSERIQKLYDEKYGLLHIDLTEDYANEGENLVQHANFKTYPRCSVHGRNEVVGCPACARAETIVQEGG